MRYLAIIIFLTYGSLALFGVGMSAHDGCPFSPLSSTCAVLSSLATTLHHMSAYFSALAGFPALFVFFVILFFGGIVIVLPPTLSVIQILRRRIGALGIFFSSLRRWFSEHYAYA
jgi:hypothetical protein